MVVPGSKERISLPLKCASTTTAWASPKTSCRFCSSRSFTSKSSGKGLGLALVAKIVRDHGGNRRLPVRGTTHHVPACCCQRRRPDFASGDLMSTPTILVADDDAANPTVLTQALGRAVLFGARHRNAATLWRWVSEGEGDVVADRRRAARRNAFGAPAAHEAGPAQPAGARDERQEHHDDGDHRRRARRLRIPAEALRPERP